MNNDDLEKRLKSLTDEDIHPRRAVDLRVGDKKHFYCPKCKKETEHVYNGAYWACPECKR